MPDLRGAVLAVGVAVAASAIATLSDSPGVVGAAAAIAFATLVQQYAALVFAHIARGREAFVGAPIGIATALGLIAYGLAGGPRSLIIALACWCITECTWTVLVRGYVLWRFDRSLVRAPILPPLYGRARWRRLGEGLASSRDTAFWGLVVARPIARAMLQVVAEQRWITPNRVTAVSIVACFGAAALIAFGGSVPLAVALIALRSILDSVDGQLARYRACGSDHGSYIDKVSDLYCWGALFAALAIRAYAAEPSQTMLLLPLASAITLALFGFALWLARALVPSQPLVAPPARLGVGAWAKSLWRIVLFEEPDFYVWIALAVATARYDIFVPFIAGAYALRALALVVVRAGIVRAFGKESPA
jgi:phosphatidylglycerophosphate synthase